MHDILRQFIGKTVRIYTVSAVESYLDVIEEVQDNSGVTPRFMCSQSRSIQKKCSVRPLAGWYFACVDDTLGGWKEHGNGPY